MRHLITGLAIAATLAACSSAPVVLVPEPGVATAELNDRVAADEDDSNERAFFVVSIDGTKVRNALNARQNLPFARAAVPYMLARTVPAKSISVTLRGEHVAAAPIHLAPRLLAGKYREVEGTVQFTPKAGRVYRATGELLEKTSSVWIEDFETGEPASEKVTVRHGGH